MRFTFSLLGSPMCPPFTYDAEHPTTVEIDAEGGELLSDLYARAAAKLGIGVYAEAPHGVGEMVAFVRFALPGDAGYDHSRHLRAHDLEVVEPDGRVAFGRSLSDTTVEDLVRTAEAGVMPGDVQRPYFIPQVPGGGIEPWFLSWPVLVGAYVMVRSLLSLAADVDAALSLADRIRKLRAGSEALVERASDIEQRRGRPDVLYELLGRRPWAPADLAVALGGDESSAVALLELFGFEEAESGLWRRGSGADADFLRSVLDEILISGTHAPGSNGGSFEDRIRYLIDHGERAPLPDWMSAEETDVAWDAESDFEDDELDEEGVGFRDPEEPLPCRCGQPGCELNVTCTGDELTVALHFSNSTDHFVASSEDLLGVIIALEERALEDPE